MVLKTGGVLPAICVFLSQLSPIFPTSVRSVRNLTCSTVIGRDLSPRNICFSGYVSSPSTGQHVNK